MKTPFWKHTDWVFNGASNQDLPKAKGMQGSGARGISWSVLCCSNIIPKAKIKIRDLLLIVLGV